MQKIRYNNASEWATKQCTYGTLLPKTEVVSFLEIYFNGNGLIHPFIHEESFMKIYRGAEKHDSFTVIRKTWLGLLNIILAIGSRASFCATTHSNIQPTTSDELYLRSWALCEKEMMHEHSLETGTLT